MSELRPCITKSKGAVDGKKALFHSWCDKSEIIEPSIMKGGHAGGVIQYTIGLVEYEDGSVSECFPDQIRFVDNRMSEYYFGDIQTGNKNKEAMMSELDVNSENLGKIIFSKADHPIAWLKDKIALNDISE